MIKQKVSVEQGDCLVFELVFQLRQRVFRSIKTLEIRLAKVLMSTFSILVARKIFA